MSEPLLEIKLDNGKIRLNAEQATVLAEHVAEYLNTIADIREGKMKSIGENQNFNWN